MTPPKDAWMLALGVLLCAAHFLWPMVRRGHGRTQDPKSRPETSARLLGLAGALALAVFAVMRSDAVMAAGLAFFALLLILRPRGTGRPSLPDGGQDGAGRNDAP